MSDLTQVLARGRARAEELMVDTCTVDRPTGTATDPATGKVTTTFERVYPTPAEVEAGNPGRCKAQSTGAQASNPVAAAHRFTVQPSQVHLPAGTENPVQVGDVVRITRSVHMRALVGSVSRVTELLHKSFATAQRLGVEEVTG